VIVFFSVITIAFILLIVSINKNQGFFSNVNVIKSAKEAVIYFSQLRTMLSTLVAF